MDDEVKRAVSTFLGKNLNQLIFYFIRTKTVPTNAKIERELAQKYGEIAERMTAEERGREFPCPVEDPEFASRIVREVFEETKREIGGEHEMSEKRRNEVKEKVKMRVMKKLGLER